MSHLSCWAPVPRSPFRGGNGNVRGRNRREPLWELDGTSGNDPGNEIPGNDLGNDLEGAPVQPGSGTLPGVHSSCFLAAGCRSRNARTGIARLLTKQGGEGSGALRCMDLALDSGSLGHRQGTPGEFRSLTGSVPDAHVSGGKSILARGPSAPHRGRWAAFLVSGGAVPL